MKIPLSSYNEELLLYGGQDRVNANTCDTAQGKDAPRWNFLMLYAEYLGDMTKFSQISEKNILYQFFV